MDWKPENETNKSAIAILRVSSRKQADNTSHDGQEREVLAYAKANGLIIAENCKFRISESAKNSDDRKQYKQAIRYALKNRIRHVLFYMSDRESRNLTDLEDNEKLVKLDKLVIHHVQDRRVFHAGSSISITHSSSSIPAPFYRV